MLAVGTLRIVEAVDAGIERRIANGSGSAVAVEAAEQTNERVRIADPAEAAVVVAQALHALAERGVAALAAAAIIVDDTSGRARIEGRRRVWDWTAVEPSSIGTRAAVEPSPIGARAAVAASSIERTAVGTRAAVASPVRARTSVGVRGGVVSVREGDERPGVVGAPAVLALCDRRPATRAERERNGEEAERTHDRMVHPSLRPNASVDWYCWLL